MTRPTQTLLNTSTTGWVARLNTMYQKIFDAPFPILQVADSTELNTFNPGLYASCLAIVQTDHRIYRSNGTAWVLYEPKLTFIADLDTGTSTITTIKNAFNGLLADMKTKGMMASS